MASPHLALAGNEEQKRKYLPDVISESSSPAYA